MLSSSLLLHVPLGHRVGRLDQAISQRRLPVVDMRHDGEIADMREVGHGEGIWFGLRGLSRGRMAITDVESAKAWLEGKPEVVRSTIAARCALRALPALPFASKREPPKNCLFYFRAALFSTISGISKSKLLVPVGNRIDEYFSYGLEHRTSPDSLSRDAIGALGRAVHASADRVPKHSRQLCAAYVFENVARKALKFQSPYQEHAISLNHDANRLERLTPEQVFLETLWRTSMMPQSLTKHYEQLREFLNSDLESWSFWARWYEGMLKGEPLPWDLQERVALIPDEDWKKGPEWIAGKIREIEEGIASSNLETEASEQSENPIDPKIVQSIKQRVGLNRDAITVSASSLLEQIEEERERVRGSNTMDADDRERLLSVLDSLLAGISSLQESLPIPGEEVTDEDATGLVLWLREFKPLLRDKALQYVSPDNVSECAIPTAIILGCTGLGSMLGMPLAGAAVGGLLTGQMKPGKAAHDLFKGNSPDTSKN